MAFHSANKTTSRDLDRESSFVLDWIDFWKKFDQIDTGTPTFDHLRLEFEKKEDNDQRPPWKDLRPLIAASMKKDDS